MKSFSSILVYGLIPLVFAQEEQSSPTPSPARSARTSVQLASNPLNSNAPTPADKDENILPSHQQQKPVLAANQGSIFNRPNARVMTLATPGIRGSILDRFGAPLAISKVSYYPALKFKQFDHNRKDEIVAWGRSRIEHANKIWGLKWNPKDQTIWEAYRYRRWMAMPYTFFAIDQDLKEETEGKLIDGLIFHPIYRRFYPNGSVAAHIIGYTGITGKLEKGPINYGDPIFPYTQGKDGLEKVYNSQLTGKRGLTRQQFASNGRAFPSEVIQKPTIGGNVFTTLNLQWQKHAEKILKEKSKRGAMVVLDVQTGEVLVMASLPSFDPNLFVPRALSKDYDALRKDPEKPLYARAFRAAYPPASSFKPIVAMAGLQNRFINRNREIFCPAYLEFNKHKFYDWSKSSRGYLNVVSAITRSNNPFFYTLGDKITSATFINCAKNFGFGSKSGLPLIGENPGNMPDNAWMRKFHNRNMHRGDHYNNAIGQGVLLATPLQVAQAMAAIANGEYLPKLQLVRQIQDPKGKVVAASKPESRWSLKVNPQHIATIKEGMMKAVHSRYGTGQTGRLSFATLCGKTGTGQWKPANEQFVAWFAGFFPLKEPKYAFAILYEGDPKEKISGGKNAAPLVQAFFNPLKDEIENALSPPARAVIVVSEEIGASPSLVEDGDIPRARVAFPDEESIPKARVANPQSPNNYPNEEEKIPQARVVDPTQVQPDPELPPRAIPVEP